MADSLPSNFDTFPTDFLIQEIIPSIVLFSVIIILILVGIPVICCTVVIDKRLKLILVSFLGVITFILWVVALTGILSDYLEELINLINDALDTINTVKDNFSEVQTCLNTTEFINLDPISDFETEYNKHKKTAEKYNRIAKIVLITIYSLLISASVAFPLFVYKSWRKSKLATCCLLSLLLFIVFLIMIPISNAGYSALSYVCGGDIDGHNKKINELIAHFDDSITPETICENDNWQYLCNVQTCSAGDELLGDFFNITELEAANATNTLINGCQFQTIYDLMETTLSDNLGCENVQGLYNKAVDTVICTEFHNLFAFTLWPVGLGTIFTILLFTVGFLYESDYSSVGTTEFII